MEELRIFLREQCNTNFYFFLKFVLGFNDLTQAFHGQITRYMTRAGQFKMIVMPRGHLKTSICTIGYAMWRALLNPNIRILIANATATNASHFVRSIGDTLRSNERVQWLFPEVIPGEGKTKWTDTEIELVRTQHHPESTIECIGVGGTVVSRHYDLIIEDDLLAPEDGFVTAEMVQKVNTWHKYATSLFVNPASGEQVVVGTRWLYDDFIAYLFQNEKWFLPCLYTGVYDEHMLPVWPERFSVEVMERILEQQGPKIFSTQYMNDPVHEDARSFDPSWLRFYKQFPPVNERGETRVFRCVTAIDPAISQKKHGDFSAIVTVATLSDRTRYVVDARRGRWGVDELIDHTFEVFRQWKPSRIGLETVMFQKALMWPYREAMRREDTILPIIELKPSSRVTKEGRIQALHEFFSNGSLWLNREHRDLLAELQGWPAIAHDDMLDALAYAMQMLVYPAKEQAVLTPNISSFEAIKKELDMKRNTSTGPFLWPLSGRQAPILQRSSLPQTEEEILEAMIASRE
jgi:predicted phage terminase large subunit-like protein